jgi:hypothetical protein
VTFILAFGISACITLPIAGLVGLGWLARNLWQGRRLDRKGGQA